MCDKAAPAGVRRTVFVPVVDSEALSDARRRELSIGRDEAVELALSCVKAQQDGYYEYHGKFRVDLSKMMLASISGKISIPPDATLPTPPSSPEAKVESNMRIEVSNETTLAAGRRLVDEGCDPLALNFASGSHPGGGFLRGAVAQEESLCRSSGLFGTIDGDDMYKRRVRGSTNWVILSPKVPVFRNDSGANLPEPWTLHFATCAAPHASMVGDETAKEIMRGRIRRLLEVARAYGYRSLVLGAWGCGAFRNDPLETARSFRMALLDEEFYGAFDRVVFAVTDWSPNRQFLGPFRDVMQ
jgi:uncharacterized protein (TIGR02452 family)